MSTTKGKMRIFRITVMVLFSHGFISFLSFGLCSVDLLYDIPYACVYFLVTQDFLAWIYEEYVCATSCVKAMFLFSPALAYSSFEKITFDCSLEHLLRHRNHDAVLIVPSTCHIQKSQPGYIPVLSFGKKLSDAGLAAQSFFLRKSIRGLCVHLSSLTDIFPMLWPLKEPPQ